jgi:hypothetical protein
LNSVDLPTLGRPTITMYGSLVAMGGAASHASEQD